MSVNQQNETHNRASGGTLQKAKQLVPLSVRVFLATNLIKLGNRFVQINRVSLANKYLSGQGVEIGALHAPLKVNRYTKVKYVDRLTAPELRDLYSELNAKDIVETDIIDDGQELGTIQEASQDFVIANHFLEHCPNPLKALQNIYRVLKIGGIFFMALPDKRFTFDIDRPITEFEHLLRDLKEGPESSSRQHYEEWASIVLKLSGDEAESQIRSLMHKEAWIHFHVWTQVEMFELLAKVRTELGLDFEIECFLKNGEECIFILRKLASASDKSGHETSNSQKFGDPVGPVRDV